MLVVEADFCGVTLVLGYFCLASWHFCPFSSLVLQPSYKFCESLIILPTYFFFT